MDNSARSRRTSPKPNNDNAKTEKSTMLDPTAPAIIQVNELRPLPGLDSPEEDETQRARSNSRYDQASVMGQVDPLAVGHRGSREETASKSQMKSVQSSVMRPVEHDDSPSDGSTDTVFVETRATRRPAVVKETNNWIKRQPITMSRKLPLGIQPEDVEARQPSKMHSHTGVPSKSNSASVSGVSGAPNSSPAAPAPHPGAIPSSQPHLDSQKVRKNNAKHLTKSRQKLSRGRLTSPTPRSAPSAVPLPAKESAISKIARSIFPTNVPPSSSSNRASGQERSPNSSQVHTAPGQQHHHVVAPIAKRSKSAAMVRNSPSKNKNKKE